MTQHGFTPQKDVEKFLFSATFYELLQQQVLPALIRKYPHLNGVAMDILHDTYLAIRSGSISSKLNYEDLLRYAIKVAYNTAFDLYKMYQKGRVVYVDELALVSGIDDGPNSGELETSLDKEIRTEFVKIAISSLPVSQSRVLELSRRGFDNTAISEDLGISKAGVAVAKCRGLKKLKALLGDKKWLLTAA